MWCDGGMSESEVETASITVGKNGSYHVSGPVVLKNADGTTIETEGDIWLCRCGASEDKPFCDGSHKRCGFTDSGIRGQ